MSEIDPFYAGDKLRKLREFHNYTQEYVAEVLGIKPNTLSDYERSKVRISREKLELAAQLFKVDVGLFFSPDPLTFNLHGDHGTQVGHVGNDLVQEQNNRDDAMFKRLMDHVEERSRKLEELYARTIDLFDRFTRRGGEA